MYNIGVDLGGTNIAVGLVDEKFNIISKSSLPTGAHRNGEAIVDDIASLCKKVCADGGVTMADVNSVGVATPGTANSKTGIVEYANNLPFKNFPLAELLSERIGHKNVKIENDANAAALGEAVAGAAKGTSISVMITLGTGVGGGIIIDGKVYSGFNCAGGELGHMVIVHNGAQCTCGRKGCWEAYSSATALIRMTAEKIAYCKENDLPTIMSNAERVSGRTACDAMRAGDKAAKEVYDDYLAYLATGITNIINIFQPEVISLGGGVSNEGQPLIDDLLPLINAEQYGGNEKANATKITIATLKNDAGIIGAAAL